MIATESATLIACWGAGLPTLLAVVKFWELWNNRFRIEVSYNFASNPDIGNTILIRNLTGVPIILSFFEILYGSGYWPYQKFEDIVYPENAVRDHKIESHSTLELLFTRENHFSWNNNALKGRKIYVRLHIAGRKPILKPIYP
jgi:hypothetical protein